MRLKKVTASFFLFLAGLTLLAHTVIPHHHHEDSSIIILSVKAQCNHDNANKCKTSHCDVPEKDCRNSSKNCTDANIVLKGEEDTREELMAAVNDLTLLLLFFSVANDSIELTGPLNYIFYDTFTLPFYTDYFPGSHGLRAPPVC